MTHQTELFDFLGNLIDIQIKKYVGLTTIGIGPDARINAKLVYDEVNELLGLAEQLLVEIQQAAAPIKNDNFIKIFNQIRFYVEQEHIRGYAGWLLDENNIHTPEMARVNKQLKQLQDIAALAKIDASTASKPVTAVQQQCEHDSAAIAFYILDLAKKITADPNTEVDANVPKHARMILKRNALTRYNKPEFAQPIDELHVKHGAFLKESRLEKSTSSLSKEDAKKYEKADRIKWNDLLSRYQDIHPDSNLFSPAHDWYKIGLRKTAPAPVKNKPSRSCDLTFFGGVMAVGCLLTYVLTSYFTLVQGEDSLDSGPKMG